MTTPHADTLSTVFFSRILVQQRYSIGFKAVAQVTFISFISPISVREKVPLVFPFIVCS